MRRALGSVPLGHAMHPPPSHEYRPGAHSTHPERLTLGCFPAVQGAHFSPATLAYRPPIVAQGRHDVSPTRRDWSAPVGSCPLSQYRQLWPSGECWPARHATHRVPSADLILPAAHATQALAPNSRSGTDVRPLFAHCV